MPAKGGEEQRVLSGNVGQFFAVTSTGVYFAPGGKEIQLLGSATGRTRTLAVLERGILGLAVSSDDAYIVWGQTDQFNQDLMLVEGFR